MNSHLIGSPNLDEIEKAVKGLSVRNGPGMDGFDGSFFSFFWEDFKHYLMDVVYRFFAGSIILMVFSTTKITLIPKIENPQSFNDFRPISMQNFINKVFSRILNDRLSPFLT